MKSQGRTPDAEGEKIGLDHAEIPTNEESHPRQGSGPYAREDSNL